jgi:hypothetical protein
MSFERLTDDELDRIIISIEATREIFGSLMPFGGGPDIFDLAYRMAKELQELRRKEDDLGTVPQS